MKLSKILFGKKLWIKAAVELGYKYEMTKEVCLINI